MPRERRMRLLKRLCEDPRRTDDREWAEDGVEAQPSFACSARQGRREYMGTSCSRRCGTEGTRRAC